LRKSSSDLAVAEQAAITQRIIRAEINMPRVPIPAGAPMLVHITMVFLTRNQDINYGCLSILR
jgi:hypothetical protein